MTEPIDQLSVALDDVSTLITSRLHHLSALQTRPDQLQEELNRSAEGERISAVHGEIFIHPFRSLLLGVSVRVMPIVILLIIDYRSGIGAWQQTELQPASPGRAEENLCR